MTLRAFNSRMFYSDATFFGIGQQTEVHRDPQLAVAAGEGLTLPAYVEPVYQMDRSEANRSPEASKQWGVFTPSDPGVGNDWLVVWKGRQFRALGRATDQSSGAAVLWRTECVEVT